MAERFKVPRGTFDVLPEQQPVRERIEEVSRRRLEAAGYGQIDTPIFEDTDLFARGVGESTDIVQKQMFTFEDQGGRGRSRCARRRPPRSAAPTSSTACRSWRSR